MNLNILVRGQSNAILAMESNGWTGAGALTAEVARLLGFDGTDNTVSLVYERFDESQATAFGGTALIGDWLQASNGDWRQGWSNGLAQSLLNKVNGLPGDQKDDPTATLWFHSEYDSANRSLTAEEWVSAVRFDAAQVRAALGQGAETTPYLFVSAMPYWGSDSGHNAIREGMELLAGEPGFNAAIAARTLDTDIDNDNFDGNDATREYGGPHMDPEDGLQTLMRAARSIAESFAEYAQPGSPVAQAGGNLADAGPQVVRAELVGANQLRLDVAHDGAAGFAPLDGDAAAGVGWSVRGVGGEEVYASSVAIEDGDTLLVTFDGALPADGMLHYGWGYGRLGGADGTGRGNAVYDDQGLPIWVEARGLQVGSSAPPMESGGGTPTPAPMPAPEPMPTPEPAPEPQPAPEPEPAPAPQPEPEPAPAPQPEPAPAPAPEPTPAPTPTPPPAPVPQQGTSGSDKLTGTAAADLLDGGAGHDRLLGRGGDDILRGGEGRDRLFGGAGNDLLDGGPGNDTLRGGPGDDRITTGTGSDTVLLGNGDGDDHVTDFAPDADSIRLAGGLEAEEVTAGLATRDGTAGLLLTLPGGETLFLAGLGLLTAEELGLDGAFALAEAPPAPALPAPPATAAPTATTVEGTAGDDWLKGGEGADLLLGGAGSDDLQGGAGDDVLRGGADHDGLTGGAGRDSFVLARGDANDWVVDFTPGEDLIRLEGFGLGFADLVQRSEPRWEYQGLVLDLGQGDEIYLQGITTPLQPSDIVFA